MALYEQIMHKYDSASGKQIAHKLNQCAVGISGGIG